MEYPELTIDDHNRIYWHSRRGMLELDLILMPFAKNNYAGLAEGDKRRYLKLLSSEDQDMFGWFLKHKTPEDMELQKIVELVLTIHHGRSASHPD